MPSPRGQRRLLISWCTKSAHSRILQRKLVPSACLQPVTNKCLMRKPTIFQSLRVFGYLLNSSYPDLLCSSGFGPRSLLTSAERGTGSAAGWSMICTIRRVALHMLMRLDHTNRLIHTRAIDVLTQEPVFTIVFSPSCRWAGPAGSYV